MNKTHKIAYTVGGDFWVPCGISIYSLVDNNSKEKFEIYILSEEEKPEYFLNAIETLGDTYQNFSVEFIKIDKEKIQKLPQMGKERISKGANTKLLLGELLPLEDENILFLDADTLVVDDIGELLCKDMSETGIAAAPGTGSYIAGLGVPPDRQYFCAGVMYINLYYWHEENIQEKCLDFINDWEPRLTEQTALNATFHRLDLVEVIPRSYNINAKAAQGEKRSGEVIIQDLNIVHFSGVPRPWHMEICPHPCSDLWLDYYEESPFTGFYPQYRLSKIAYQIKHTPLVGPLAKCVYRAIK